MIGIGQEVCSIGITNSQFLPIRGKAKPTLLNVGLELIETTLAAYTLKAYDVPMVFVELTPFVAFRDKYWTDEDLRALQNFLLVSPDAGDLIQGGSGLRKVRWSAQGRGKRGGARVIYYWHVPKHYIYLIYGFVKNEREDLSPMQIEVLAELVKDLDHG